VGSNPTGDSRKITYTPDFYEITRCCFIGKKIRKWIRLRKNGALSTKIA
jgi:hypothetical protein